MSRPLQARSVRTLETILDSAEALVAREGVSRLTLDGVVAEAGLSKGALQYHFRSKEALITALVVRKLAAIRCAMDVEERALGDHHDRVALAMVRCNAQQWDDKVGFPPALLAAAALNSDSIREVAGFFVGRLDRIRAESDSPDQGIVLVFAALGILLANALGFSAIEQEEGRRLFQEVERMLRKQV